MTGNDPFGGGQNPFAGARGRTGDSGQGFRGYEYYQSQVDPEELFRKIFGDAFSRGGFGNHEWANDGGDHAFGQQGITQVSRISKDVFALNFFHFRIKLTVDLTFQEAVRGCNKDVNIRIIDTCPTCKGSRCAAGTSPQKCRTCNGTGMETIETGPFFMRASCRTCHGRRETIPKPCYECSGKGKTAQKKFTTIPIPAGVEDGQTMRVNLGSSEVFVTFRVKPSEKFRRDREDIHSEINLSIVQATLGGTIKVPGILDDHLLQVKEKKRFFRLKTSKFNFQIPPGTQSHQRFRLIGKGIKRLQSPGTGDHYVHVKIKIPT